MSLNKQLGLLFFTLLLLLLAGVLGLDFFKSKEFLERQLARQTESTAHILAYSLRSALQQKRSIEKIVDTIFENSPFTLIEIEKVNDHSTLYRKKRKPNLQNIPSWFVEELHLHIPTAETIVEPDNGIIAKLKIEADTSSIYKELYELFLYTVTLFVVFGVIGLIFVNMIVGLALGSLEQIRQQAEGIIHNRFIIRKRLPRTKELRNIATAMNTMVKRVKDLYERSAHIMKESQEMLYHDQTTGLFNRRYFQLKLPEYLLANDTRSRGVLMMIRMKGIIEGNKRIGHKKMDDLLIRFANILNESCDKVHEPLISRLNGTEFALLLPVYNLETAKSLARDIIGHHLLLCERFGLRDRLNLKIGICAYERKMQPSKLLSCVDSALAEASMYSDNHIVAFESDDTKRPAAGKSQWREIISKALKEGRLQPNFSAVHDLKKGRESMHLLSFDIATKEGLIHYGDFIPAVIELGLEYDLMQYEFDYLRIHRFDEQSIGFEMIADMLQESDKLFIFEDTIKEISENVRGRLFVEISEHDLLALEPIVVEKVAIALKTYGVRLGINRFTGDKGEYSYLKYSAPAYVKMSENSFLDLDDKSKNALLTLLGSLGIELIIVDVHAENIPALQASAIRYIMYS